MVFFKRRNIQTTRIDTIYQNEIKYRQLTQIISNIVTQIVSLFTVISFSDSLLAVCGFFEFCDAQR